jgi:hypothetical protein
MLFIPKEHDDILSSVQRCCQLSYKTAFNVQEIGIYEKIIEQLKPFDKEEEKELEAVYNFIINNSKFMNPS